MKHMSKIGLDKILHQQCSGQLPRDKMTALSLPKALLLPFAPVVMARAAAFTARWRSSNICISWRLVMWLLGGVVGDGHGFQER